jgi:lipopolysaccharide transport system ATP-binding protein
MPVAIKAEKISKAYRLGEIGTGTLQTDLKRWYAVTRGKEDPFLKIGETNDRSVKGVSNVVWSLKDISFEIEQGDAVGIVGKNGAGKSTLLKILSRVTSPTTGKITGNGRVASLLEVGTGFHPELTGRENIYLNGAILGMRKKEITRKFDEIVDFAGIERYIDTPVKRYSSGMYVRLAFAVAAHLESEILIVDEVLAVGDAEFQKKCLGKMNEVSKGEGKTILFVSHNMEAIIKFCNKAIFLQNGLIIKTGTTLNVINAYLKSNETQKDIRLLSDINRNNPYNLKFNAKLTSIKMVTYDTEPWQIKYKQPFSLIINFETSTFLEFLELGTAIYTNMDFEIASSLTSDFKKLFNIQPGKYEIKYNYKDFDLLPNFYKLGLGLRSEKGIEDYLDYVSEFEILISEVSTEDNTNSRKGILVPNISYEISRMA